MNEIILSTQNGEPVASSREVAKRFGKEHKHVLAAIRQILAAENSATKFFHETAFEYRGQRFPEYLMNRDGFSLLAMGFTGKEAVQWKLKYIQAFNEMEKQLAQRPQLSRAELMAQALIAAHDELEHKDAQIAELTPKGIFADAVSASKKSMHGCCLFFFDIFAVRFSGRLFDFTAREVVTWPTKKTSSRSTNERRANRDRSPRRAALLPVRPAAASAA